MHRLAALLTTILLATPAHAQTAEAVIKLVHPAYNRATGALDEHFHLIASDVATDGDGNRWCALLVSSRKDGRYSPTDLEVELIRVHPKEGTPLVVRRSTNAAGTRADVDDREKLVVTWRSVQVAPKEKALALSIEGGSRVMGEWLREVTWYRTSTIEPMLVYQEIFEGGQRCATVDTSVDVKRLKKQTQGFFDFKLVTTTERESGLCDDGPRKKSTEKDPVLLQWDGRAYSPEWQLPAQFTVVKESTAPELIDGRDTTASTAQSATITLLGVLPVQELIVTNGCAKGSRAKTLQLTFDGEVAALVELKDIASPQVVALPQIVRTGSIRLDVKEPVKDDVCLSDVRVQLQP